MHGWDTVETARCTRCAIYTPTCHLVLAPDGRAYCLSCGAPETTSAAVDDASADAWVRPPSAAADQRVRVVAAFMLLVTLAFPLAACVSHL